MSREKITKHIKRQTHSEETELVSETDSDMAKLLEQSDQEFKTTIVTVLRALMDKVDSIKQQTGNVSRKVEILKKNQKKKKKLLEIKSPITEMKNALDGLISRLDMSKRTSDLEDIAVETFKTKKQRRRRLKKA